MSVNLPALSVIIPAAGVGKRMKADKAKQYLPVLNKAIIEHSIEAFIDLPFVDRVFVVLAKDDPYFNDLKIAKHPKICRVDGGNERADSVLAGVLAAAQNQSQENDKWCMVHDAARPCLKQSDIENLYRQCLHSDQAGILAVPVRDTMKRAGSGGDTIELTVDRTNLWHALTPQCAKVSELQHALLAQQNSAGEINDKVTDEASALEMSGIAVNLVAGDLTNIKVTHPQDLTLAELYLTSNL